MSLMDLFNNITKGEFESISGRFSEELRILINQMILVDPSKRVDSNYIFLKSKDVLEILNE